MDEILTNITVAIRNLSYTYIYTYNYKPLHVLRSQIELHSDTPQGLEHDIIDYTGTKTFPKEPEQAKLLRG